MPEDWVLHELPDDEQFPTVTRSLHFDQDTTGSGHVDLTGELDGERLEGRITNTKIRFSTANGPEYNGRINRTHGAAGGRFQGRHLNSPRPPQNDDATWVATKGGEGIEVE